MASTKTSSNEEEGKAQDPVVLDPLAPEEAEGSVNPREEAKGSADGLTEESKGEEEEEHFKVDEHLLLGFLSLHGDKNCLLTPVPHKVQGFTKEEMSNIIGNAHSGQYCVAFYHEDISSLVKPCTLS